MAVVFRGDPGPMRQDYHLKLDHLAHDSSMMCKVAANCLREAIRAMSDGDLSRAQQVIAAESLLGQMRSAAETRALELLSLQAPVASELRTVVAALWIVADLQRMGSLAVLVARCGGRRHPRVVVPPPVRPIIEEMGRLAAHLADQAGVVLRDRDILLAGVVESEDHRIDDLQREMFAVLLAPAWSHGVEAAVDMALLGRYLERFADHAVAIARRVVFMVTGENANVHIALLLQEQRLWRRRQDGARGGRA